MLDHIPPVEETAYDASLEPTEGSAAGAAASSSASAAADLAALLGLDAGMAGMGAAPVAGAPAAPPAATQASAVSALADLLAGDLLGGSGGSAVPAPAAQSAAAADPLAGLFGAPAAPAPAAPAAAAGPTLAAFQKGPLTVTFQLSRGPTPADTDILAVYSNSGGAPLEAFALQVGSARVGVGIAMKCTTALSHKWQAQMVDHSCLVFTPRQAAVPKQMTLRLEAASSVAVRGRHVVARAQRSGHPLQRLPVHCLVLVLTSRRPSALPPPQLPPHSSGAVTQRLHVHNALHGQKALVMRLRISYSLEGQAVLEQAEVDGFPAGY